MPQRAEHILARYGTAIAAAAIFVLFAVAAPNFIHISNLLEILKDSSFLAILGLGFSLAFVTAELDLSFANICSLAAVVTGGLIHEEISPYLAVLAGLVTGVASGALNGILVTRLKIPSLIATLGTASAANGLAFAETGGVAFVGRWDPTFLGVARGSVLGIPNLVLWTVLAAALVQFLLTETRLGMRMIFVGEADEAARLAGVKVCWMKFLGLSLSGLTAGFVAVLLTAHLNSAAPNMAGDFLLTSIAAVLVGMTMFQPGRVNVPGTLLGAFMIGMLGNGLVLLGAPYYVQDILIGVILVASVGLSAATLKKAAFGL
jgi:ribose transport system permease protein